MSSYFTSAETWKQLLSNDFNRGYLVGVALVLGVVVLFLLLRLMVAFFFRTRRARTIVVTADDGDVQISQDAIAAAVGELLDDFPELVLDTLKIYRNGGHRYFLLLQCRFRSAEKMFPDVIAQVKEKIFHGLEKQFGISDLRKIRVVLAGWESGSGTASDKTDASEKTDAPEIVSVNGSDGF